MPVKKDKTDKNKKLMLDALEKYLGRVTDAINDTGLSKSNYYQWLKDDPEFAKSVEEINEVSLDHVESMLIKRINGYSYVESVRERDPISNEMVVVKQTQKHVLPNVQAITFYLETKGKKRGYGRKLDVELNDKTVSDRTSFSLKKVG